MSRFVLTNLQAKLCIWNICPCAIPPSIPLCAITKTCQHLTSVTSAPQLLSTFWMTPISVYMTIPTFGLFFLSSPHIQWLFSLLPQPRAPTSKAKSCSTQKCSHQPPLLLIIVLSGPAFAAHLRITSSGHSLISREPSLFYFPYPHSLPSSVFPSLYSLRSTVHCFHNSHGNNLNLIHYFFLCSNEANSKAWPSAFSISKQGHLY